LSVPHNYFDKNPTKFFSDLYRAKILDQQNHSFLLDDRNEINLTENYIILD